MHPLLTDPWVAARIDAAVAPFRGRISDRDLAFLRAQLAETLASDARAARTLARARPRVVDESGEALVGGAAVRPLPRAGGDDA
jgi:hypothetical protein